MRMMQYRNTKQRKAILDIFGTASKPLSAAEVFEKVQQIFPAIALTTIYRNLDLLTENKLLTKHRISDHEFSYEISSQKHRHYIICLSCRQAVSIDKCPFDGFADKVEETTGYEIVSHDIQLYGYCKGCK